MRLARKKILVVVGTRPEAIKIAPLLRALQGTAPQVEVEVCVTRPEQLQGKSVINVCGWQQ